MADIVINEISQNYSYVIGDSSYCCVALPITSCWGPAYTASKDNPEEIEDMVWQRFKANSQGLESFVSTYRGAAANYRLSQDYSYQMAVSLLTAGYDVLVCRLCPGAKSSGFLRRSYVGMLEADWGPVALTGSAAFPSVQQGSVKAFPGVQIVTQVVSCEYGTAQDKVELVEGVDYTLDLLAPTQTLTISDSSTKVPAEAEADHFVYVSYIYYSSEYKDVVLHGNLTLPIENASLYCDADHPVTVTSTHPNFSTTTITSTVNSVASNAPTGVYVVNGANSTKSIIFHLNGTPEQWQNPATWAQYGIVGGESYTATGDKDLEANVGTLVLTAKYPGTFGNRLQCSLRRMTTAGVKYWNLVTYIVDASGVRIAVENLNFVFDIENSTESIPYVEEVQSQFIDIIADHLTEDSIFADTIDEKLTIAFRSGADKADFTDVKTSLKNALELAEIRYKTKATSTTESKVDEFSDVVKGASYKLTLPCIEATNVTCQYGVDDSWQDLSDEDYTFDTVTNTVTIKSTSSIIPTTADPDKLLKVSYTGTVYKSSINYINTLCSKYNNYRAIDATTASTYEYLEWVFTNCLPLYGLLEDKLAYNPNRVISPGWDDQNFLRLTGDSSYNLNITTPSPIHLKLMETAYKARCATAYIDLPKSLAKQHVSNDSQDAILRGYAQLLARQDFADTDGLFTTHSALFGPWGTYMYVGTSKQATASPSFLALLIQRSMILNQSLQYEWIQPSSRKNNVNIGKMDYTVSKKYLDAWQPDPDTDGGVGVNAIANIPDLGLSIWGDSTLYENPPATYQALRNLSTRLLVNAIKNVVYKVGISITFQYTNQTAFSSFYVGVTPLLDTMKNSGAIDDYKVIIGNDFDAVGMVKANSCVGKIYITPNGTIQHIAVDLIAMPPQTDLSNYT